MVYRERFREVRGAIDDRLVKAVEAHRDRAGLDAGQVEDTPQAYAQPLGVAHGAVRPLGAGNPGLEQTAGIARALVDGGHLHARHGQDVGEGERQGAPDPAANVQFERCGIDLGRHVCPVPAYEELVVGGEHALVEDAHWRL